MSGRGRVRFELLLEQVLKVLPSPPATVVDAGGGTGQLAVPLAGAGYRVTVLDTSAAMLATCAQRAAEAGVEVGTVQGDVRDAVALLGSGSWDAAVCHEVLSAVEEPEAVIGTLGRVVRPGGTLSLAFANRDWQVLRAGSRGEYAEALRLLTGGPGSAPRQAFTIAEVQPWLERAGFELAGAFGVGALIDQRDEDLDRAHLATLLELERRASGREPYRSAARLVHLVGRRRG